MKETKPFHPGYIITTHGAKFTGNITTKVKETKCWNCGYYKELCICDTL